MSKLTESQTIEVSCFMWIWMALFLAEHFYNKEKSHWVLSAILVFVTVNIGGLYLYLTPREVKIDFFYLLSLNLFWAVLLFITISIILIGGGSKQLTIWRGEKWVKELDYIYLGFGMLGAITSISNMQNVENKIFTISDLYGPWLVSTAIVIRAIKTRAEINNWQKISTV